MMPSDRLVLALADSARFAPPSKRPDRRTEDENGQVRSLVRSLGRHLDLAVREHAGPWIPRITARYPY